MLPAAPVHIGEIHADRCMADPKLAWSRWNIHAFHGAEDLRPSEALKSYLQAQVVSPL